VVRCPTLLVWGEHDRLVPPEYGEAYRQHLPHAQMIRIAGCGHLPMFEREQEFVDLITRFARE
jgi:pimeloyl-ACP methyl ester carboxylesterase